MDLEEKRNALKRWISDAVADGWSLKPTYGPNEPVEFAGTLTHAPAEDECVDAQHRTTWVVSYLDRPGNHAFNVRISAWGPDRLSVAVPQVYSMKSLRDALRMCVECRATDVDVVRLGFAGRVCQACREKLKAKAERNGWTS